MRQVVWLILLFLLVVPNAWAQRKSLKPKFDAQKNAKEQKTLAQKAAASREDLIAATKKYRDSLDGLMKALKDQERLLAESLEKKQALVSQGLIVKRDLEPQEQRLADIRSQMNDTNKRITQADQFMVEIMNLEQLAKNPPKAYQVPGSYFDNTRYIRYTGTVAWSLRGFYQVESYFQGRFKQSLPVSAFGQSDTHNRLGFDHSNSFDVALHPDTAEAQELMSYLRSRGIPFTAFRGAIPGNATGAHIHIGYPSHRFR
ncbi:MAG TPA: hypothetical protein VFZ34_05405 [Blastocatellia bacterium]|nr:hypothetical protein [Blastocatellia bacterium]